jgi:hypothetical protein
MSLAFVGDVMLFAPAAVDAPLPGRVVLNLEAPIVPAGPDGGPPPARDKVVLRAAANHLAATFGGAIAAVNLANNHAADYGRAGLAATVAAAREAGAPCFGAGDVADACRNPLLLDVDGVPVALLGYACPTTHAVFAREDECGVAPLDVAAVARDVAAARAAGAARVVVNAHWGVEHVGLPRPDDVAVGRALVDAGADLVVGHHAHVAQPWETYRGATIAYGLGSFLVPDLDVPTMYDAHGVPRGRLRKRMWPWHRRSLVASWDPRTNAVAWSTWYFDGRRVRQVGADAERYRLRYDPATYPALFRRAVLRDTWRDRLGNYAADPVLPRPRHLRSILNITAGALRAGRQG